MKDENYICILSNPMHRRKHVVCNLFMERHYAYNQLFWQ